MHSKYPFFLYKDITYLPLTWNNLQTLGIEFDWSEENGLLIWPNRNFPPAIHDTPPEQDLTSKRNSAAYAVQLSNEPITINNTIINNRTEPYPFLTYQDVTYMPLTWRFVHDLLHLDIRWSETQGLALIGGQSIIGPLIGDDDRSLYFYSMLPNPDKSLIKMEKDSYRIEWKNREEQEKMVRTLSASAHPYGGKPAEVQRKDRDLYYGDVKIYTLTDSDVWESNTWGAPVHSYTEFKAGDQGVIISINIRLQIAAIGPNYGSTYTVLVRDGKATMLQDFNQKLDRVIPNPDGTVWIASARLPGRNGYIIGSARLGLLDQNGHIEIVNDKMNESDVLALGLTNPSLSNPAAEDGSLYMVLLGHSKGDFSEKDSAGLYTLDTKLQVKRLSEQLAGEYYLDKNRNIYIQHANNTIENGSTGELRTWFDYELAAMN